MSALAYYFLVWHFLTELAIILCVYFDGFDRVGNYFVRVLLPSWIFFLRVLLTELAFFVRVLCLLFLITCEHCSLTFHTFSILTSFFYHYSRFFICKWNNFSQLVLFALSTTCNTIYYEDRIGWSQLC